MLGCTAKSLMPAGTSPGAAVSPLGLPTGLGIGALIVDSTVQSRVRRMAMVLSSDADINFDRVGKYNALMLEEWWRREPISRFLGFSITVFPAKFGRAGFAPAFGGIVESW